MNKSNNQIIIWLVKLSLWAGSVSSNSLQQLYFLRVANKSLRLIRYKIVLRTCTLLILLGIEWSDILRTDLRTVSTFSSLLYEFARPVRCWCVVEQVFSIIPTRARCFIYRTQFIQISKMLTPNHSRICGFVKLAHTMCMLGSRETFHRD